MGATNEEPRCAPAGALSARDFGRRFPGGPPGLARQGRAEPLAGGDRPAQGRVGRRVSAVAKARSVGAPLCLRLGRWRLSAGADGATGRMHASVMAPSVSSPPYQLLQSWARRASAPIIAP